MTVESKQSSSAEMLHAFIDGAEASWDASPRYDAHEAVERLARVEEAARELAAQPFGMLIPRDFYALREALGHNQDSESA
jgi:hypothetical protein